jgi:hypothetical protein|tara:strand:- start:189 stop:443 length:255 start_codon:yes stop_codon:yes gene_type:complete
MHISAMYIPKVRSKIINNIMNKYYNLNFLKISNLTLNYINKLKINGKIRIKIRIILLIKSFLSKKSLDSENVFFFSEIFFTVSS